ncbi:DUF4138 domain-containing protein [Flavobacterium poyangense]|uniref:DUF4138 domain-containing protein n=1 Tax=Flavobacterium poyangense TaxID=2204302 RepID=UPI00141F917C|nr:DUF4138 domain-containing protein [Flavobacterium sp. JXAS1]
MSCIRFLYVVVFNTFFISVYSQNKIIDSVSYDCSSIDVSDKLTTHLIFSNEVNYIDIGSAAFSVDKVKNIVKIKCTDLSKWNAWDRTNLTVVTKNGYYYSLWITYNENPQVKTYMYKPSNTFKVNSFDIMDKENCNLFLSRTPNFLRQNYNHRMKYEVNGIFYNNDKIMVRLKIANESNINFTTDSIRFVLTTKKKFNIFKIFKTRSAIQYNEKKAAFVCNNTKDINAKSDNTYLFGFDRFVPTDEEVLEINVSENNSGGRRGKIILKIKDFLLKY